MLPSTPITVVIVGCFAAGKTTLAKRLSKLEGIQYFNEVGGDIRARSKCTSSESCSIFDELVMFRELERDSTLSKTLKAKKSIILEQWHIGNIGYAKLRNPQVAEEYIHHLKLRQTLQEFSPIVFLLDMDPNLISTRINYAHEEQLEKDLQFFSKLQLSIEQTLNDLNILPIRISAAAPPEKVFKSTYAYLEPYITQDK